MVIHKDFDNFGEINNQNLEKISAEIMEKKKLPEYREMPEKEIVREHISTEIKKIGAETKTANAFNNDLPDYLKNEDKGMQMAVEKLVEKALNHSIVKAISAALHNPFSPFILKSFHDSLTDKLYNELKQRKLI